MMWKRWFFMVLLGLVVTLPCFAQSEDSFGHSCGSDWVKNFRYNHPNDYLICIETTQEGKFSTIEGAHTIKPNQEVWLIVYHYKTYEVAITEIKGVGIYHGDVKGPDDKSRGISEDIIHTERQIGTFKPDEGSIEVALKKMGESSILAKEKIQLYIERFYKGAYRVGIGLIGQPAVDRAYSAQKVAGSQQREIVASSEDNLFDMELVVGHSWFIPSKRTYPFEGLADHFKNFGIFLGFGVVGWQTSDFNLNDIKLKVLKSFYLGLDYEIAEDLAIVPALGVRYVSRLASYQKLGEPIGDNEEPDLQEVPRLGFSVLICFSPEIFKTLSKATTPSK